MTTTGPTTNAGWYPDPATPGRIRYWDGRAWTAHSLQAPPTQAAPWSAPSPQAVGRQRPPWWRRWWAIAIAVVVVLMIIGSLAPDSKPDATADPANPKPPQTTEQQLSKTQSSGGAAQHRATVPSLTGMSLAQARQALRSNHLVGGYVQRRPSGAPPGTVLAQGVRIGKRVAWRSAVPLVIAVALPQVPALIGQSGTSAARALRSAGFRVRTVQRTVTSGTAGAVLSESPSPGSSVRPHALITIVVAHAVRPVVAAPSQPATPAAHCTPGYSPCLTPAYDYDCAGGSGDGPKYVYGVERVTGSDPYDLDADGDGYGCD